MAHLPRHSSRSVVDTTPTPGPQRLASPALFHHYRVGPVDHALGSTSCAPVFCVTSAQSHRPVGPCGHVLLPPFLTTKSRNPGREPDPLPPSWAIARASRVYRLCALLSIVAGVRLSAAVAPKFPPISLFCVTSSTFHPLNFHLSQRFPLYYPPIPHYNYKILLSNHIHLLLLFFQLLNRGALCKGALQCSP
jgi:hypothetical protein